MLGEMQIEAELFGIQSHPSTYVHRISCFEATSVGSLHDYFDILKNGSVTLFPTERRVAILTAFGVIEKEHGVVIEVDEDLLDEVIAITEHPTPLLGGFDENFLTLPPEVIITSMKEHQRYFPVFKEGKLINAFVVVSNALADDFSQVVEGNERVLRPRLSDALFFYHNDLKRGLSTQGLEKVVFMNGLGTIADKIGREKKITSLLLTHCKCAGLFTDDENIEKALLRTMDFAKADLMSEMVYEFTELQGLMGSYYFQELYKNEDPRIAKAISEQYQFSKDEISNDFSAIVNISMKLDTLIGMFSIGEIPTGSRDPFALRRAVNGIINIAIEHKIPLNFSTFIDAVCANYPQEKEYKKNIETFIVERLSGVYPDVNPSIVQAVVNREEGLFLDILALDDKIIKVDEMAKSGDAKESFSLIKRLANILKDEKISELPNVSKFNDYEKALFDKYSTLAREDFSASLEILFEIKKPLDDFFTNVMVNDEDLEIRANRKKLLAMIYEQFNSFADFKQITL
jgi:glycyl-tRNA synthetase beta chain